MTKIEWTRGEDGSLGRTWNPTTGCDRISPGCSICYAMTMAARLKAMGSAKYQNDGDPRTSGPGFGLTLHPDALDIPLKVRKPTTWFVNSMSDLFHPDVPATFVGSVWAIMAVANHHQFQVLTKRPQRMANLVGSHEFQHSVAREMDALAVDRADDGGERWAPIPGFAGALASSRGAIRGPSGTTMKQHLNPRTGRLQVTLWRDGRENTRAVHKLVLGAFQCAPNEEAEVCHRNGDKVDNRLVNLRWGTRSENQREKVRHGSRGGPPSRLNLDDIAEIRASAGTQQAIADRFGVSRSLISLIRSGKVWASPDMYWPLPNVWLGTSIENDRYTFRADHLRATPAAIRFLSCEPLLGPQPSLDLSGIDWVIVGAESGKGARPMNDDWVRDLRDRAKEAGAAFFFKQRAVNGRKVSLPELDGRVWDEMPRGANRAGHSA